MFFIIVFASLPVACGEGADPEDLIFKQITELAEEYVRIEKESLLISPPDGEELSDETLTDEEWLRKGRHVESKRVDPDSALLPEFLDIAKSHPKSPYSFDVLFFVIRKGGPQTGNVDGIPWQIKEDALDIVAAEHTNDSRFVYLLDMLSHSLPSKKTEAIYQKVIEEASDPRTLAAAHLHLARYYNHLGHIHRRSKEISEKEHRLNHERFWDIVVTPYMEKNFPYDEKETTAEAERLLRQVRDAYSHVPALDWKLTGPGRILVKTDTEADPETYGDLAKAELQKMSEIGQEDAKQDLKGPKTE